MKGCGLLLLSRLICFIVSILFLIMLILFAYFFEFECFKFIAFLIVQSKDVMLQLPSVFGHHGQYF